MPTPSPTPKQIHDFLVHFEHELKNDADAKAEFDPQWTRHEGEAVTADEKALFAFLYRQVCVPFIMMVAMGTNGIESSYANCFFSGFQAGRAFAKRERELKELAGLKQMMEGDNNGNG